MAQNRSILLRRQAQLLSISRPPKDYGLLHRQWSPTKTSSNDIYIYNNKGPLICNHHMACTYNMPGRISLVSTFNASPLAVVPPNYISHSFHLLNFHLRKLITNTPKNLQNPTSINSNEPPTQKYKRSKILARSPEERAAPKETFLNWGIQN